MAKFLTIPGRIVKTGKIVSVMDHTPQHKAKIVTEFDENKDYIKMLWPPPGTPEITGMEGFCGKANPY